MKSLFSMDVEKNEPYGKEFILRETDFELTQKSDQSLDTLNDFEKKSDVPVLYTIIQYLLFLSFYFLAAFIKKCIDDGFTVAYKTTTEFFYIGTIGFAAWLAMTVYKKIRYKKVVESTEVNDFINDVKELNNTIRESLLIPENSASVDVLCRSFKLKNGKKKSANLFYDCLNFSFWVFIEGDNLCFADTSSVYGIPLDSFTRIDLINKSVMVPQWNKDEPIKDEKYKKYVKVNGGGIYFIKPHYSLRFNDSYGEEWEVLIPAYEIEVISKLTGKSFQAKN